MTTYDVRMSLCPNCGFELDKATDASLANRAPQPLDLTLCIECGQLNEYGEDMLLRSYPLERLYELRQQMSAADFMNLVIAQEAAVEMAKERRDGKRT